MMGMSGWDSKTGQFQHSIIGWASCCWSTCYEFYGAFSGYGNAGHVPRDDGNAKYGRNAAARHDGRYARRNDGWNATAKWHGNAKYGWNAATRNGNDGRNARRNDGRSKYDGWNASTKWHGDAGWNAPTRNDGRTKYDGWNV